MVKTPGDLLTVLGPRGGRVGEMPDLEDARLDSANERRENSRLSCQIPVTEELEGLTVTVVPPY